ncbi:hypothetical protein C8F04DRAFT_1074620 [Mycena alexandri]|uniref:Uncharacterized protein n=1 Tax=Mycena alexandri TaxID=1745969 RepID=A0AAD6X877_9AGAR|nr:hypothetical protein C8F04DRAFT_1074620 [Mycena alexandri]
MFVSVILLSAALGLASATPTLRAQTTCSPPETAGVSLIGAFGAEASVPQDTDFVGWVRPDAAEIAPWSFVKSNSSFLIKHKDHPDTVLTGTPFDGMVRMTAPGAFVAGSDDSRFPQFQNWNITCTICPPSGLANNCTFSDVFDEILPSIPPRLITVVNCLNNYGDPELGNSTTFDGDCLPDTVPYYSIMLDYHQ